MTRNSPPSLDDEEEGEEVDFHAIAADENAPLNVDPPASSDAEGMFSTSPGNMNGDWRPHSETGGIGKIRPEAASLPSPHSFAQNMQSELFPCELSPAPKDVPPAAGTLPMVSSPPVKPRRIEPPTLDKLKDEDFR